MAKFDQYTGLQQYTGRAKRVTPSEASIAERSQEAERSSANSPPPLLVRVSPLLVRVLPLLVRVPPPAREAPPPAREGAPLEAPLEASKNTHFRFISHHNQNSQLYWPGVFAVMSSNLHRKNQEKSRKMHATCGDDVMFFILLALAMM